MHCSPIVKYDKILREIHKLDEGDDMYCNHCGKKLSEDDFFCSNCGTRVERNDIWSGDDDGSFDETVLYNPKDTLDALAKEKAVTDKNSKIRDGFTHKAGEDDGERSVDSLHKAEKSTEWVLNETAKPLFKDPDAVSRAKSARQKEDIQMQVSREQSARAAKRLQDRWKHSANEAQDKMIEEHDNEDLKPEKDLGSPKSLRKWLGFNGSVDADADNDVKDEKQKISKKKRDNTEKKGFFSKRSKPIEQKEEVVQSEKTPRTEKENSLAGLFLGIILLGLVIGIILGLIIAKPWASEEEEPPENPTPLMVVMPYTDI